jgi:nicotinate-nucleotide adenylyltransferase
MGADNFLELHLWRDWRRLARLLPLAVFDRPGARFAPLRARAAKVLNDRRLPQRAAAALSSRRPPAWAFVFMPRSPLSSTAIRREGRAGVAS